ncbi:MAG: hypothetical protein IKB88_00445 [Clostridia bacterium]|nr:hypothetical protein [Clostridia bacterium]
MKKFIFYIALFLAGTVGVFGTLSACCGALPGVSNALSLLNTPEEIILFLVCLAVMIFGLAKSICEVRKDK